MRATKLITISILPEFLEKADEAAREENRTRSELIREALRRYLADREWRRLHRYGIRRAQELGLEENDVETLLEEYRYSMKPQEIKEQLPGIMTEFPVVGLVYLFGSQAGGRTGPGSDYDLGVWLEPRPDSPELRAQLTHALVCRLGTDRVDLVWLHQAPVELAYAVISQGTLLYERDVAVRVEYEAQVMSRYGDYLPVLRAQRSDILQGGERETRIQRHREALGRTERTLGQIRAAQKQTQS